MAITVKFLRACFSFMMISGGIISTPLLSMENNDREDSVMGGVQDTSFAARVVEVVSGDTIKIQRTGSNSHPIEEIKLDGIWAPKKDVPLGISSIKFLENMFLDRDVTLKDCVNSCYENCCFNKIKSQIYIDGVNVNKALISQGMVFRTYRDSQEYLMGKRVRLDRMGVRTCSLVQYPRHPILRARFQQWFVDEEAYNETPLKSFWEI